jgi:hypothetical protein
MKTIEVVLIVATLLGGLAAVVYFWDKIVAWFRRRRAKQTLPEFAPGRWHSDGETNTLVIADDLNWTWTSTFQGNWSGSGRGEVRDGYLVLRGSRVGTTTLGQPVPRAQITIKLKRESETLAGQIQVSRTWDILFIRDT